METKLELCVAHLWKNRIDQSPADGAALPSWAEHRLDDRAVLDLAGASGVGPGGRPGSVRILCSAGRWVLVASPAAAIAINGAPASTGIRVLADRDEIHIGKLDRIYFSTESPPAVVPYPLTDTNARCPRCQQSIEHTSPSVRCHCGAYYHQTDELPCFVYGPCVLCCAPPSLDGAFIWTPEEV